MSGPIPARVDSAAKTILLDLIDDAVKVGWTLGRICGVLELDRQRAWRWRHRQAADRLDDATPGGRPVHGLLAWEEAEILALFEEWGPIDLSHRKLAHRGSYTERVWVSPSTVDRVLARNGLALQGLPRPSRSSKKPWPDWVEWRPNQLWCWDASHFSACVAAPIVYGIIDIVSRKWIASLLCAEATGTQVKVVFLAGPRSQTFLRHLRRVRPLARPRSPEADRGGPLAQSQGDDLVSSPGHAEPADRARGFRGSVSSLRDGAGALPG